MTEDPRKTGLKNGLRQLTIEQLQRVIDYPDEMVYDSFNYQDGKFCALAVGVGLDKTLENPSHELVFQTLSDMGYSVYNTRGIKGEFYTTNRKEDLLTAAKEVIQEHLDIQSGYEGHGVIASTKICYISMEEMQQLDAANIPLVAEDWTFEYRLCFEFVYDVHFFQKKIGEYWISVDDDKELLMLYRTFVDMHLAGEITLPLNY